MPKRKPTPIIRARHNITTLRESYPLTTRDIAARLGVSRSYWDGVESGRVVPSILRAQEIAKALGCTLAALGYEAA